MSPPRSPLQEADRRVLLGLARRAIVEAVFQRRLPGLTLLTGPLAEPCGAFVTLHHQGRLCGCIGQVSASEPLADTVVRCAIGAAVDEPRFRPLRFEELGELEIQISVLSPLSQSSTWRWRWAGRGWCLCWSSCAAFYIGSMKSR